MRLAVLAAVLVAAVLVAAQIGCTPAHAGMEPDVLNALVASHARAAGISASLGQRLVQIESRGNPRARGKAGEYGLTQIKCSTARGLGFRGTCGQLLDPGTNLRWGFLHVRRALDRGSIGSHQAGLNARRVSNGYVAKFAGLR